MSITPNEIQVSNEAVALATNMNRVIRQSAATVLSMKSQFDAFVAVPANKEAITAVLLAQGSTYAELEANINNIGTVADYVNTNVPELPSL